MRLLNARTQKLEDYFDEGIPRYAILSHTWGAEEVTFSALHNDPAHVNLAGYAKISEACRLALEYGVDYVWVDTCCIDKSSSAELSEAINSMFRWYEGSYVCFVYLADVPSTDDVYATGSVFRKSRWWSRGWTLQELLAPNSHVFFGSDWGQLLTLYMEYRQSTSASNTLRPENALVRSITGIHVSSGSLAEALPLVKLSWASKRQTTRKEDIAYCLLGLLDVQLPLLYGEGTRAFRRLLIKVMEEDNSHDIFLAGYGIGIPRSMTKMLSWGLLPESPAMYSGDYTNVEKHRISGKLSAHFEVTNAGLRIELPLISISSSGLKLAVLDCRSISARQTRIAMLIRPVSEGEKADSEYERVENHGFVDINHYTKDMSTMHHVYLRMNTTCWLEQPAGMTLVNKVDLREPLHILSGGVRVLSVYPCVGLFTGPKCDVLECYQGPSSPSDPFKSHFILLTSPRWTKNVVIKFESAQKMSTGRICTFATTEATSVIEFLLTTKPKAPLLVPQDEAIAADVQSSIFSDRVPAVPMSWWQAVFLDPKDYELFRIGHIIKVYYASGSVFTATLTRPSRVRVSPERDEITDESQGQGVESVEARFDESRGLRYTTNPNLAEDTDGVDVKKKKKILFRLFG